MAGNRVILSNTEYNYSIKVIDSLYSFTLNDKTITMSQSGTTVKGEGYKLYTYFGGNETATHDIVLWINEL